MRVRSPIGDLPFAVTGIHRDGRELVVQGELGAWPSEVRVSAGDLPMLARAARRPLIALAAVTLAAVVWRRR